MKQLQVKCDNIHQKIAIVSMAYGAGFNYGNKTLEDFLSDKLGDMYDHCFPHVLLKFDELERDYRSIIDFVSNSWYDDADKVDVLSFLDLAKISELLFSVSLSYNNVKISEDYDAVVSKDGIQVGCQTISFEDFDKLTNIVSKFR